MAVTYSVTDAVSGIGPFRVAYGTFTSAQGDGNGETLTASTHAMNRIVFASIFLDTGAVAAPHPKVSISEGTVTWTVDDTFGLSGRWFVMGK